MCEKNKKPQETIELTDDQLDNAVGGEAIGTRKEWMCSTCDARVLHEYRGGAVGEGWYCTVCGQYWGKGLVIMIG